MSIQATGNGSPVVAPGGQTGSQPGEQMVGQPSAKQPSGQPIISGYRPSNYPSLSVAEIQAGLAAKQFSAIELTRRALQAVEDCDQQVQAFLELTPDLALQLAERVDAALAKGATPQELGSIAGVPVAFKDNMNLKDTHTTCASRMLERYVSPFTATCVAKALASGGIPLGKLNMDEFAFGSSTETSAFGCTHNPWDLQRVPGGSSGGSAAAVAAGMATVTLGSDTGGSIRQPAAHCGVVGLKPTYGRVSRYGVAAFASSLDQVGPLAHTVEDAALLLQAIAGPDPHDGTALANPVPDYRAGMRARGAPWKIGVPKEYFAEGLHASVAERIREVMDFYRAQGCSLHEVSLPRTADAVATYYIIATAEASSNLARYDGIRYGHRSADATNAVDVYALSRAEGFGDEVKRRVILGTYVLTSGYYDAYYVRAQKVRTLIRNDFMRVLNAVDMVLAPVSPTPPERLGEKSDDVLAQYLGDVYTIPVSLAGLPGISVPCGFVEGLPVGFQLIGKPLDEETLLAAAHVFERAHDFAALRPALAQ